MNRERLINRGLAAGDKRVHESRPTRKALAQVLQYDIVLRLAARPLL
jgi:hypothetical protein